MSKFIKNRNAFSPINSSSAPSAPFAGHPSTSTSSDNQEHKQVTLIYKSSPMEFKTKEITVTRIRAVFNISTSHIWLYDSDRCFLAIKPGNMPFRKKSDLFQPFASPVYWVGSIEEPIPMEFCLSEDYKAPDRNCIGIYAPNRGIFNVPINSLSLKLIKTCFGIENIDDIWLTDPFGKVFFNIFEETKSEEDAMLINSALTKGVIYMINTNESNLNLTLERMAYCITQKTVENGSLQKSLDNHLALYSSLQKLISEQATLLKSQAQIIEQMTITSSPPAKYSGAFRSIPMSDTAVVYKGKHCRKFDVKSNVLKFPDLVCEAGQAITIDCTIYVPAINITTSSLFTIGSADGNDRIQAHVPWENNHLYWDYGQCSQTRVECNFTPFCDQWIRLTLVGGGCVENTTAIYINGKRISHRNTLSGAENTLKGLELGAWNNHVWPGYMSEFSIYNSVFPENVVKEKTFPTLSCIFNIDFSRWFLDGNAHYFLKPQVE